MIGIRLRPGYLLAGVEADADGTIPVVGATMSDADTVEDADAYDLWRLRRRHPHVDDEALRALVVGTAYEAVIDRPHLDHTPTAISYADALSLIEDGWADAIEADADAVEQHLEQWAGGSG